MVPSLRIRDTNGHPPVKEAKSKSKSKINHITLMRAVDQLPGPSSLFHFPYRTTHKSRHIPDLFLFTLATLVLTYPYRMCRSRLRIGIPRQMLVQWYGRVTSCVRLSTKSWSSPCPQNMERGRGVSRWHMAYPDPNPTGNPRIRHIIPIYRALSMSPDLLRRRS